MGTAVGFSEAQTLAREVDKLHTLGSVKLLNFAYLSLDRGGKKLLGAGSFSKVYAGRYRSQPVAVKMLFTQDLNPDVGPHPHVVSIFGVAVLPPSVCIILEICPFGSLSDVLRGPNGGARPLSLSYADRMFLALGCARGVLALHSHNPHLCHRDIKSYNFLIDAQLNAKIADLDLGHEQGGHQGQKSGGQGEQGG
ncbi:kinase-like domain-containing protein [Ochromonadaceae sp. CCMP2298]|nr:kinase-like domain-containing protein [Ochromonadaceae sp. CCMP2298]